MRPLLLSLASIILTAACSGSDEVSDLTPNEDRDQRVLEMSEHWPKSPDYSTVFIALTPLGAEVTADDGRPVFDSTDDYGGLPRTGEYEFVAAYCSACHSLEIVMQQRASRERWSYMLTWMVEKQGMVPLEAEDEELFLDYLVEHFGP